jgi:hypothetical protein
LKVPEWLPADLRIMNITYKVIAYMHLTQSGAWHYLFEGCFRAPGQQQALASLIDYMAAVNATNCDIIETPSRADRKKKMRDLRRTAIHTLVAMEREFPRNLFAYCFHNLIHLCDNIFRWNHVRNYWAFFMERCMRAHMHTTSTQNNKPLHDHFK